MAIKNEIRPNPDPHWVKDTLAEEHAEYLRGCGVSPRSRDVEDAIAADLAAYQRSVRQRRASAAKSVAPRAQAVVDRFRTNADAALKIKRARARGRCECGACKLCKLEARIRILIKPAAGHTMKQDAFLFPRAAADVARAMVDSRQRRGRFADLSGADVERALLRELEDIADRYAPELGSWR